MAEFRPAIWIRNLALGGVILAFVVLYGLPTGDSGPNAVARIGDEQISRDVFEFFRAQNEETARPYLPKNLEAAQLRQILDRQTLDSLVRRYLLAQEAQELGLRVTDAEVKDEINLPIRRGEMTRIQAERIIGDLGERNYKEEVRRDLLLRKLQRVVGSPQRVPTSDAERRARAELVQMRLRYARASVAKVVGVSPPEPDEVRAFADTQSQRVEALYQRRLHEFQQPEQVSARHILFQGDAAAERATAAQARLQAGEDFEELAKELSDDRATRDQGGDLGSFPRGRVLPDLEQAAFALEAGQVSEPVSTERGVHLVLVEERQGATEQTLEEVRFDLARELLAADRARDLARDAAHTFLAALRSGVPYDEAGVGLPVDVELTPMFSGRDPLPGELARIPGIRSALIHLKPGTPVDRVFSAGDDFFVVWVDERVEADPDEVASHAERTRERLEAEARGRVLTQWYLRRMREMQTAGELEFYPLYPAAG